MASTARQGLEAPISNGGVDRSTTSRRATHPDELINNEIGWKTEFFDHRLQVNGSLYYMKWNNVQMEFYNPPVLGNTTFAVNGPNFTVKGLELQVAARVTDGLTLHGIGFLERRTSNQLTVPAWSAIRRCGHPHVSASASPSPIRRVSGSNRW